MLFRSIGRGKARLYKRILALSCCFFWITLCLLLVDDFLAVLKTFYHKGTKDSSYPSRLSQNELDVTITLQSLREQAVTKRVIHAGIPLFDIDQSSGKTLLTAYEEELQNSRRQKHIVKMMKHAWDGYVRFAWGDNEFRPVSKRGLNPPLFGSKAAGVTIVDAADTLHIMGLHAEFEQARKWIGSFNVLSFEGDISVFEINIRYLGGLLSCYALTNDKMFLNKATELATALLPAFDSPTGIPYALYNLKTKAKKNHGWGSGMSVLSEFGSLQLEWTYLSKATNKSSFNETVSKIIQFVRDSKQPGGLYSAYLNPVTGKWGSTYASLGACGDSFYEYLFKMWLWGGKIDSQVRQMYDRAMEAMEALTLQTSKAGRLYFGQPGARQEKMEHLACFAGGLYALSAPYASKPEHYMNIAKNITSTCRESYAQTAYHLGPEVFKVDVDSNATGPTPSHEITYVLRPEVVESYFVLWRVTKNPMYREWGWEAAQAIETYCRTESGYSGIKDLYNKEIAYDDAQPSFFLAETLKYLYLLFAEDDVLPLDKWVFNTEAHPLPLEVP